MKTMINRACKLLCLLLCVSVLSTIAYDLCRYYDYNMERLTGFYAEPEDTLDVVILGASEVWFGYSAGYAYDRYGFTSYPFAIDLSVISLFESELTEILKRQDPKCIVVDINPALCYEEETFTDDVCMQRYLNNIPGSWNRTKTIMEMVPMENWYYFFFPLSKAHSNWKEYETQWQNVKNYYQIKRDGLPLKGIATYNHTYDQMPTRDVTGDDSSEPLWPAGEYYLRAFLEFCRSKGIENILFVRFPHVINTDWAYKRYRMGNEAQRIIAEYGYSCLDLERDPSVMGLDYATDFCDEDHLNIYGQRKLTAYLGEYLIEEYGIGKTVLTAERQRAWEKTVEHSRLFYKYCENCFANGMDNWIEERDFNRTLLESDLVQNLK